MRVSHLKEREVSQWSIRRRLGACPQEVPRAGVNLPSPLESNLVVIWLVTTTYTNWDCYSVPMFKEHAITATFHSMANMLSWAAILWRTLLLRPAFSRSCLKWNAKLSTTMSFTYSDESVNCFIVIELCRNLNTLSCDLRNSFKIMMHDRSSVSSLHRKT